MRVPQFITTIDGVDIHFIHARSRHPNALPVIITHGWPGSVFELLKIVGPLLDSSGEGGRSEDAFDVVMPLDPGSDSPASRPAPVGTRPHRTGLGAS